MIVVLYIYQIQDYKIKLKSSKQLIVKRIYTLYKKKLETLRKYIEENLMKIFTTKSQLFTGYLIFFILKKTRYSIYILIFKNEMILLLKTDIYY